MVEAIMEILPYAVLLSHALLAVLFLAVVSRNTWGASIVSFVGGNALLIAFLVSLAPILGSLFYSDIVGFEACVLCWWQRVFLYPQAVIFAVALWKKDKSVFSYSIILAALAGVIAFYQSYVYWGGASLLPCTTSEGDCSKIYVMEFGYITIPVMSLTVVLYFAVIAWINRIYRKNENSNA